MGARAEAVQAEFDAYKAQVRAEALRVAADQGWCDSGLNRTLRTLGLSEKRDVSVRVQISRPAPQPREYVLRLRDAETEEQARQLLADPQRLAREVSRQVGFRLGGSDGFTATVVEPAAATPPADAGAVPQVGQPCPPEGTWYRVARVSQDPAQCRELHAGGTWYCTRPTGHEVSEASPHVAAGRNEGVRHVWAEGGTPRASWLDNTDDDDDDEYDD